MGINIKKFTYDKQCIIKAEGHLKRDAKLELVYKELITLKARVRRAPIKRVNIYM